MWLDVSAVLASMEEFYRTMLSLVVVMREAKLECKNRLPLIFQLNNMESFS